MTELLAAMDAAKLDLDAKTLAAHDAQQAYELAESAYGASPDDRAYKSLGLSKAALDRALVDSKLASRRHNDAVRAHLEATERLAADRQAAEVTANRAAAQDAVERYTRAIQSVVSHDRAMRRAVAELVEGAPSFRAIARANGIVSDDASRMLAAFDPSLVVAFALWQARAADNIDDPRTATVQALNAAHHNDATGEVRAWLKSI